jgi:hypothetical protein
MSTATPAGFWNDYKQTSQEVRLSSACGGFVDTRAASFLMDVKNEADYRRRLGQTTRALVCQRRRSTETSMPMRPAAS